MGVTPSLIRSYDAAVATLLEEIEGSGAGDQIDLNVFIVEPGLSSETVLRALGAAADRGARVRVRVDATSSSALGRLVERTGTLLPQARKLAASVDRLEVVLARDSKRASGVEKNSRRARRYAA